MPSKSRHANIVPSDDVDDSRVVEDAFIPFEITSVIDDILVDSNTPILDQDHVSSESTNNAVDALLVML